MAFEEIKEKESSVSAIKRVCRVAYWLVNALCVLFSLVWFGLVAVCLFAIAAPTAVPFVHAVDPFAVLLSFVYGVIIFLILKSGSDLFKEILDGKSPFTVALAKRVRRISYLLIAKLLFSAAFPLSHTPVLTQGGLELSYVVFNPDTPTLLINPETLMLAILFFCISLVIQYGVLLQHDSEDFL